MTSHLSALGHTPVDPTALDLRPSDKALELRDRLVDFMHSHVFPAEHAYEEYRRQAGPDDHTVPPVVEELRACLIWRAS